MISLTVVESDIVDILQDITRVLLVIGSDSPYYEVLKDSKDNIRTRLGEIVSHRLIKGS